jgi:flagellar motor switch protein FliG
MSAKQDPPPPLASTQKVAAFLLSLDKQTSARILKLMDANILPDVASAMTHLDERLSERKEIDNVYRELSRKLNVGVGVRSQDEHQLATILEAGLGKDGARTVVNQIEERRRIERPFAQIEEEPVHLLALALREESNAVVAVVLAHSAPERSATVLGTLEPDNALDVVLRMASLQPPSTETLLSIASDVHQRIEEIARRPKAPDSTVAIRTVAQMLTFTGENTEKSVIGGMIEKDEPLAVQVKEAMFTWDNLSTVDKRAMQKILGSIETKTLAVALKGCDPKVEANILGNISDRVRTMVADERELAGALPMRTIQDARGEIMTVVRSMMEAGEFKPTKAGEELVS